MQKNRLRIAIFTVFSRAHRNKGWTTDGPRPKRTSRRLKRVYETPAPERFQALADKG
jgi:hypothetical protein